MESGEASSIGSEEAVTGSLIGTAIGDALGLPYEGLRPQRAARLLGPPTRYRFLFGRGMVSDDTEHACLVLLALLESRGEPERFARCLGRRLRHWFLLLPAGVGKATAISCLKLLVGYSPQRSGVHSAGNGPAMRAAILGAAVDDLSLLKSLVRVSSRLTHTDPKAEHGAFAAAFAARTARHIELPQPEAFFAQLRSHLSRLDASALLVELDQVEHSLRSGESTEEYSVRKFGGRGVSGYTLHTVPAVLHAWLSNPRDFRKAITSMIRCGGDADTTAAILGGILGAGLGAGGLPEELLSGLREWPRNLSWMKRLAKACEQHETPPRDRSVFFLLPRNLLFLAVVLVYGVRRLLPPW